MPRSIPRLNTDLAAAVLSVRSTSLARESDSVLWLATYVEDSRQVPTRFKTVSTAIDKLRPLVAQVPFVPVTADLYHLRGTDTPSARDLAYKPTVVTSLTAFDNEKEWLGLASEVGADGFNYLGVYQVTGTYHQLSTPAWLKKVSAWVDQHCDALSVGYSGFDLSRIQNAVRIFAESYQQEVLAYGNPLRLRLVKMYTM